MNENTIAPTSDERLMAAIAHFFGFFVALIIWATQKDKSRYVRFQSLQALVFDIVVPGIVTIVVGCVVALSLGLVALGTGGIAIFGSQNNPNAGPIGTFIFLMTASPFAIPCIVIPLVMLIFVVRLIASIETFQGKDFHYPLIGNFVERSLNQESKLTG